MLAVNPLNIYDDIVILSNIIIWECPNIVILYGNSYQVSRTFPMIRCPFLTLKPRKPSLFVGQSFCCLQISRNFLLPSFCDFQTHPVHPSNLQFLTFCPSLHRTNPSNYKFVKTYPSCIHENVSIMNPHIHQQM